MRTLAIIPARGGSKGLPGKHFLRLGGSSLMHRAMSSADEATTLSHIVITTDDVEVAAEANKRLTFQMDIVMRPGELATDTAGMIPVMQHAVSAVEALGEAAFDLIVLLQPTSPFRTGDDIDRTVALVRDSAADSAQTLVDAAYRPWQMVCLSGDRCLPLFPDAAYRDLRRQDPPGVYQPSGAVYVTRRDVLMEQGRIIGADHRGLVVPWERSININSPWDFRIAEMVLMRGFAP